MVNKDFLSQLSSECLIVNSARGEIVVEAELEDWLRKNPKAQAYLDVFEKEPFRPGHMSGAKNVNKTSHIAGVYRDLNQGIIDYEKLVIADYLDHAKKGALDEFRAKNSQFILAANSPSFSH